MWIERAAEGEVRAHLAKRTQLVTVHGLGGMGASTIVARALVGHDFVRWDLGALAPAQLRLRARALRRGTETIVWLDQAHHALPPRVLDDLRERSPGPIVIAGRTPTNRPDESCVPVPRLEDEDVRTLLHAELARLGVRETEADLASLVDFVDGWPLAIGEVAKLARLGSTSAVLARGLGPRRNSGSACRTVVATAVRALDAKARDLLAVLSFARAPIPIETLRAHGATDRALTTLLARGLLMRLEDRARVPRGVASSILANLDPAPSEQARRRYARIVLTLGEEACARHRRDPISANAELAEIRGDLLALSCDDAPRTAVRAALALEPLLTGLLHRSEVLSLFERARRAAARLDGAIRATIALALARTLITRADHESAEQILAEPRLFEATARARAYRALYLGHVAVWRNDLAVATRWFDQIDVALSPEIEEDTLVQRMHVALRVPDLAETARLARIAAALATSRPSPRLGALAQHFLGEARLREGQAHEAARLLESARLEMHRCGDHVTALYCSVRLVEALRAAGDDARADYEAQAAHASATRGGEMAFELVVLGAADGESVPWERVAELAWRVQIPLLRAQAERWMAARPARPPGPRLLLDRRTQTATLGGRRVCLATRPTLWRALVALATARSEQSALSGEAVFAAAWPGERAEATSRKKRVQTAVWSLRKVLLGEHLETCGQGYFLRQSVRIEEAG